MKTLLAKHDASALPFKPKARIPVIDIAGHHSVCELNYHRLLRLLPRAVRRRIALDSRQGFEQDLEQEQRFQLAMNEPSEQRTLELRILDSAPFTSTIALEQHAPKASFFERVPKLVVRLYHDAEMAEIISWDRHRQWQPRYEYPNPQMYQPDEKLALNRFLADWLCFVQDRAMLA